MFKNGDKMVKKLYDLMLSKIALEEVLDEEILI
jgi:hypothetical protein